MGLIEPVLGPYPWCMVSDRGPEAIGMGPGVQHWILSWHCLAGMTHERQAASQQQSHDFNRENLVLVAPAWPLRSNLLMVLEHA